MLILKLKSLLGFIRMKWEWHSVFSWLATTAIQCFWRDVARCNNAWKKTRKIKFNHIRIDARATIEIESTSVGLQQIPCRFRVLRARLFPRDKYTILHRNSVLYRTDDRARRLSRCITDSRSRNLSEFIQTIETTLSKHETGREIDMDATFKRKLGVASQNLAIG